MIYSKLIKGSSVNLRAVSIEDVDFILKIRNDPNKSKYLHKIGTDRESQIEWIKERQMMSGDYYFIITDKNAMPIGTIGLSNIKGKCGETSRYVSYGNPMQNVEANLLITDFAFDVIGLEQIEGYILKDNKEVISLQKKFGYKISEDIRVQDGMEVVDAVLDKATFSLYKKRIVHLLNRMLEK